MIELRSDGTKYVKPGPHTHGRVYMVINQMTGEVGYNCTTSDLPGLEPRHIKIIEEYDSFGGWMTEIISCEETMATVKRLNGEPKQFIATKHTLLVARVIRRLSEQHAGTIDGFDVLDDMHEMYTDLLGRQVRPALPGWKK